MESRDRVLEGEPGLCPLLRRGAHDAVRDDLEGARTTVDACQRGRERASCPLTRRSPKRPAGTIRARATRGRSTSTVTAAEEQYGPMSLTAMAEEM